MANRKSGQTSVTTPEKPLLPDLERAVQNFAARLRSEFRAEIDRDAPGFKRDAVRLLGAALSAGPRPGRPPSEAVTRAIELRAQGKPWQAIYAQCLTASLADDSRQIAQSRLRCAVRSRHAARRRRKSHVNCLGE
jgi:hypothetical protein